MGQKTVVRPPHLVLSMMHPFGPVLPISLRPMCELFTNPPSSLRGIKRRRGLCGQRAKTGFRIAALPFMHSGLPQATASLAVPTGGLPLLQVFSQQMVNYMAMTRSWVVSAVDQPVMQLPCLPAACLIMTCHVCSGVYLVVVLQLSLPRWSFLQQVLVWWL